MSSFIFQVLRSAILSIVFTLNANAASNPLAIPPLLTGKEFELTVQSGTSTLLPGIQTPTYGVNGVFLGPTLMINKGDSVTIHVKNLLNTSTTMHWHGLHVPARFDGGPHQIIAANALWSPSFKMLNDAGTYWYHPHGEGKTELQVSKGIAGMIIVHDSVESALGLPHKYGVDDIPLVIQTKAFDELYQIAIATEMDTLRMVNGTVDPLFIAPAQVVRLRLLNGSSMRSYVLGFSNNMIFYQIATDGGLIENALAMNRIRLVPGERVELLIDLRGRKGQSFDLRNFGTELSIGIYGSGQVGSGMASIPDYNKNPLNGSDYTLLHFSVKDSSQDAVMNIPMFLRSVPQWSASQSTVSRTLEFAPESMSMVKMVEGPFTINGQRFNFSDVNLTVQKNAIEIWTLKNSTLIAHPFHIHDVEFNILDINGFSVPAFLRGRKDVVLVMPQETVRFITRFDDFADNKVPYMYHCHMLHHEDDGMMGSFFVSEGSTDVSSEKEAGCSVVQNATQDVAEFNMNNVHSNEECEIVIYDVFGRSVLKLKKESGQNSTIFSTLQFTSGVYILNCITKSHADICKFIIQR